MMALRPTHVSSAVVAACLLTSSAVDSRADVVIGGLSPMIVAGDPDPSESPPDAPDDRVDPNTTTSPYAGVGSLGGAGGGVFGSGAPFTPIHILTAAHVIEGANPASLFFRVNYGGDQTIVIQAAAVEVHPDWGGFNVPEGTVNDDIGVVTLRQPLPTGVPIYSFLTSVVEAGTTFTHVGYGATGDGVSGYDAMIAPSPSVKRVGTNNADEFIADDGDGDGLDEVYVFDFDPTPHPDPDYNIGDVDTLGNDKETTFGGGDSGGPAFVYDEDEDAWKIAGNNTFVGYFEGDDPGPADDGPAAPLFGSLGGGMLIYPYLEYLNSFQYAAVPEAGAPLFVVVAATLAAASGRLTKRKPRRSTAP